jgi:hypothetical protein
MTISLLALLLGLFGVPALLMILGHRLRRRTESHKRRFWGGVLGYVLGIVVAVSAMVLPPVWWADGSLLRPFLVHWSMVTGGVLGVLTGPAWARPPSRRRKPPV